MQASEKPAQLNAISCLGASRTPAVGARGWRRHAGVRETCTHEKPAHNRNWEITRAEHIDRTFCDRRTANSFARRPSSRVGQWMKTRTQRRAGGHTKMIRIPTAILAFNDSLSGGILERG